MLFNSIKFYIKDYLMQEIKKIILTLKNIKATEIDTFLKYSTKRLNMYDEGYAILETKTKKLNYKIMVARTHC